MATSFCEHCGRCYAGASCPLCAPDAGELDPFQIHDVSPKGDGSLLKVCAKAGAAKGPQDLRTPTPLCRVEVAVRQLRPDASELKRFSWIAV